MSNTMFQTNILSVSCHSSVTASQTRRGMMIQGRGKEVKILEVKQGVVSRAGRCVTHPAVPSGHVWTSAWKLLSFCDWIVMGVATVAAVSSVLSPSQARMPCGVLCCLFLLF